MAIDDDDFAAFRAAVEGATPIKNDRVHFERTRPKPRARFSRDERDEVLDESMTGNPDPTLLGTGEELFYARPGLPRQVLRKLKRGHYTVATEIDLHGLTGDQAHDALRDFLSDCVWHRHTCVRVITGKGKRSGHRGPVIKPRVSRWLRKHDRVDAFSTCRPNEGGSGALYVLLNTD